MLQVIVACALFTLVIGAVAAALWTWLQIARDVIAEEGDEEDADRGRPAAHGGDRAHAQDL